MLDCTLLLSLLKQSAFPKLSRPVGATPAQAPSLEMAFESELRFPLLHAFGFLHPCGSSLRMHINCKCIPHFGRESNSSFTLDCDLQAYQSSFHLGIDFQAGSVLPTLALGVSGTEVASCPLLSSCNQQLVSALLSSPRYKQQQAVTAMRSTKGLPRLCCEDGHRHWLRTQTHPCLPHHPQALPVLQK